MTTRKMLTLLVLVLTLTVSLTPSALANEGDAGVIGSIWAWVEEWLSEDSTAGEPASHGEDLEHYNYMPPGG